MSLTAANAAIQILAKAMDALNAIGERSRTSKDGELKVHISALYDELLALKETVVRLTDENAELRRAREAKPEPELRQVGAANFYFVGEKGPYCQKCHDGEGKLVALSPTEPWNGGERRHCTVCGEYYYEKLNSSQPIQVGGRSRTHWMER